MVHVDDAVRAYVSTIKHKDARGIYNVVEENGVTSRMFAEVIAGKLHCKAESVTKKEAEETYGPMCAMVVSMNNQADSSKAKRELGWVPRYTSFSDTI